MNRPSRCPPDVGFALSAKWWPALGVCALLNAQPVIAQPSEFPPLGTIDFYGLGEIPESEARALLPLQEGFDFAGDLPDIETVRAAMAEALGVARVDLNLVCCNNDGSSQLYVGVAESAQSTTPYYAAPTGGVQLPADVVENFDLFLDRMMADVLAGTATENREQGHALADAGDVRETQEIFLLHAAEHLELLIDVLQHSSNARHRAVAAHVLGYAAEKPRVAPLLAAAVRDPSEEARNYATRALAVMAVFANANPDQGIEIPSDPFIAMLNSIVWSDRNKSLAVLANLTAGRDADLIDDLSASALVSLIEMCEWQHWGHAAPACLILQRITGLPDDDHEQSRDSTLARARALIDQRNPPG